MSQRGAYRIQAEPDGSLAVTLYAPRDGAGRATSASDLTLKLEPKDALRFRDDVVMACTEIGT
ncbi:MAG: hypothetical protein FJ271_34100 [Planctomycetes bacterium]|nr:hypothetical protein [Alphaproteobacteria bacterium]MBM4073912.1 hypothetical protein [Planctomycetota bacterium]